MATGNIVGNTQEERNVYFTRAVPYLNQPSVVARFGIIPTYADNLAILNPINSNPNPVLPQTKPDNLGYLELWVLHTSPGGKHDPLITELFHAIEKALEKQLHEIYGDIPQSMLTATDRSMLNLHLKKAKINPVVTGSNAMSTEKKALITIHLSLKKQIHLMIEVEVNYAGTKSKAKRKDVKDVELYMLTQAANITTIPDPNETPYTHIGDLFRGTFTKNFTAAQEGLAALFTLREKNKKGVFGPYIGVFRVVIS
ncbi:MAG: hypothetical protein ACYDCN_13860 [Bacteroidia bacterium]